MSLRSRLLLAAGLILLVVVGGAAMILRSQAHYLTNQIDERLSASRPFLGRPPTAVAPAPVIESPDQPVSDLYVGLFAGGELQMLLQGQLLDDVPELTRADITRAVDGEPFTVGGEDDRTRFRVVVMRQAPASDERSVIALPLDEADQAIERLQWGLAAGVVAITTTLLVAVWWVERLGLRPVARVTAVADAIAHGDRTRRVEEIDERTEAGRLATAFNVMLDERDASEGRLRRFVSDASHELRTPLTSIRGYLDLYREGGFRGDGQLDDAIRRMSSEAARMQTLVEDLLLLAKLDEHPPIQREPIDVAELLEDLASDARVLQPERPITVEATSPAIASGDRLAVEQLVGVLVSNALVHTDRHAQVHLAARTEGTTVEIMVHDAGPGLDAAQASRVFDRFYRGDASRARTTGSSGLGLAIARSIVDTHDGGIHLATAPGEGCTFIVRLPAAIPPTAPVP